MHKKIAAKIAAIFPKLQKLNDNEKRVLKSALIAAGANGYDMGFVDEMEGLNLSRRQIAGYLGDLAKKGFIDAYGSSSSSRGFSEFAPSRELLSVLYSREKAVFQALETVDTAPKKKEKAKPTILETKKLRDGWKAIQTEASYKQNLWYLKAPDKKIKGYIKHLGGQNWQVIDKKTGLSVRIYRRSGDAFRYGPSYLSS